ncbi:MAG: hypothetical protein F4X59_17250 [Holophagales bacterium]|nr:hypothetical protein [Holophagales bacterium]MYC11854.1 hypothetical protein [Holophagales bacterium]
MARPPASAGRSVGSAGAGGEEAGRRRKPPEVGQLVPGQPGHRRPGVGSSDAAPVALDQAGRAGRGPPGCRTRGRRVAGGAGGRPGDARELRGRGGGGAMTPVSRMLAAIWRAVNDTAWAVAMDDPYERALLIATELTEAMGGDPMPTAEALRREVDRAKRDQLIRRQFHDGLSYDQLAKRHGLSTRQVRRIVKAGDDADIATRVRDRD